HVADEVPHEKVERLATQALVPQRGLADADADLRALRLGLPVAVVRLADRAALVLDGEELSAALLETADPLARRGLVLPATGVPAPLEPRELRVVPPAHQRGHIGVGHLAECHARPAQDRRTHPGHELRSLPS